MTVLSGFWFPGVVVSEVPDGRGLGGMQTEQVARRCQGQLFVPYASKLLDGAAYVDLLDLRQHEGIFCFYIIRCCLERRVWGEGSAQVGSQAPGQVGSQAGDESEA